MKTIVILFVLASVLMGCQRAKQPANQPKQETPKALREDKSDVSSFLSKSGREDLLEALYAGLIKENQQLQDIESLIEDNRTEKNDIVGKYNDFNQKSDRYYSDAREHCRQINDSVLRKRILAILKTSSDNYQNRISYLAMLVHTVETKNTSIDDYHTAMKIVVTLPLIENFQRENLPKDSIFKGFNKKQDNLIRKMDNMMKK